MSEPAHQTACPFLGQLVAMLLEDDPAVLRRNRIGLYGRLIDLEREAFRCGAPPATRALIGRVRRISGSATIVAFPRVHMGKGERARTVPK